MVKHGRAVWFNRQERLRNCKTKRPPGSGLSAALIKAEISPLQSPPTADLFTSLSLIYAAPARIVQSKDFLPR
jgi:hypothetical protein